MTAEIVPDDEHPDFHDLPGTAGPVAPGTTRADKTVDPDRAGVPWPDWVTALGRLEIGFWLCPAGHSDTVGLTTAERAAHWSRNAGTVEWRGGTARCLHPDCGRTSADA